MRPRLEPLFGSPRCKISPEQSVQHHTPSWSALQISSISIRLQRWPRHPMPGLLQVEMSGSTSKAAAPNCQTFSKKPQLALCRSPAGCPGVGMQPVAVLYAEQIASCSSLLPPDGFIAQLGETLKAAASFLCNSLPI